MKELFNWYEVIEDSNFYDNMTGKLVAETPKTVVLKFNMNETLGGFQRVQFYKEQVEYRGEY